MTRFKDGVVKPNWADVLRSTLKQAEALKGEGVVVFDLDSTLFDNRPRQARILREFGKLRDLATLTICTAEHWSSGWDMKVAMLNCGLGQTDVDRVYEDARKFWMERFFTSEYCADDVAIEGAVDFIKAMVATGIQLCYVTGRHEDMRLGTVKAMQTAGMVTPGNNVQLIMKPSFDVHDDDFKRQAHTRVAALGTVVAAFDNEPTHVNDYRLKFPEAIIIHVATDHSGRPVELLEGITSVPHFFLSPNR
ncbi:MAG: HAD family acid phosphatase [Myxococcaceae bacterium]